MVEWSDVRDYPDERMEFGACHVRCAWRTHQRLAAKFRFLGLRSALHGNRHSLQKLLQDVGGNENASNQQARGEAIFAAVWFPEEPWAILCDATRAALVDRETVESIDECRSRDDAIADRLREVFANASPENILVFDDGLYQRILERSQRSPD
jgi:hypothetical protein